MPSVCEVDVGTGRNLTDELKAKTNLWRIEDPDIDLQEDWDDWDLTPFVDWMAYAKGIECAGDQLYTEEVTRRFSEEQLQEMYFKWQLEK